ncbi:fimbrial protein [Bacteroides sp. 519]|uniref:fimbrial protein n=1 Tax=Bacteroides sp. 519 TaxID=2302937 RepID=UPI0013D4DFD8|nr:fimbrial protein [Bacteroides sp. 519]NDV56915.1 hypothetical protein [Bacteroides sp. 519]
MRNSMFLLGVLYFILILGFNSCTDREVEGGTPVVILVSAESRADSPNSNQGDPADRTIATLRVLVYESVSGKLAFNIPVPAITNPTKLDVKTGKYDFVFIANEGSDSALATQLAALTPGVHKKRSLYDMSFAADAFVANKNIPMVTCVNNVLILDNEEYQTPNMQASQTGVWPIAMERLGIRLDLSLKITQLQYNKFVTNRKLYFTNVPNCVYLFPFVANNRTTIPAGITVPFASVDIVDIANPINDYTKEIQCKRIILPENTFLDITNESKALTLTVEFGTNETASGILCLDPGNNYTLPRNTYFDVSGIVQMSSFIFDTAIKDWASEDFWHEL